MDQDTAGTVDELRKRLSTFLKTNPTQTSSRPTSPTPPTTDPTQRDTTILPQFMFAINTAKHETTGFSPAFLNFGRSLVPPSSLWREVHNSQDRPVPEAKDLVPELQKLRDFYQITKARPVPEAKDLVPELQKLRDFYQITKARLAEVFQRQQYRKLKTWSRSCRNYETSIRLLRLGWQKVSNGSGAVLPSTGGVTNSVRGKRNNF
ncbi:hypothetical protein QE152_g40318 [Popillia japonica]|uniref:Uncharacterized protein n=1 Tax=Popillia japonica TaxID=7064 RepID=A0AAW1HS94_POPJA